uniref:Reverse transcriptase domain-containing protein n=1 Tax=Tanacetum cinerariifolium TaxID=118510 RepID=A0A6L2KJN0_TANCI|nr:reverse transcriptase domain-containing protein [Tanacetum cinerariifolium]
MSVRLAYRSFQCSIGIAKNIQLEVGKITFPVAFLILEMEEDSKVLLILVRPFLHTADAEAKSFIPSRELLSKIFGEFDEFITMNIKENTESESEEITFEIITFDTDDKIKKSLNKPPTDLELKPLPDHLEYAFLEEPSFLPMIISSQFSEQNKNKLVSVLKRHKKAFAWKTTDIPAKKLSSDEEASCSDSDDEEYAMAVRDFKKFFRIRGTFDTLYYISSSLDSESLQNEYNKFCKLSLRIINKNKLLKSKNEILENEIYDLRKRLERLEKNKDISVKCESCVILHSKIESLSLKLAKFKNGSYFLQEMIENQRSQKDKKKRGLGFTEDRALTSKAKTIKLSQEDGKTPSVEPAEPVPSAREPAYTNTRNRLPTEFSKKQTTLAISTTKAEYVSARKAYQQTLWMKQDLVDYDIKLDNIPILCDNKGVIDLKDRSNKCSCCCLVNPRPASPPYQNSSPPIDYQTAPPSSPIKSPSISPITSPGISPSHLLNTPKTSLPPLTSPPPAPSQPSKQTSPLSINLEPVELIFSTPPTSPHPLFDSLKDLPPQTANPPPSQTSFDTIERLANHPPPLPIMEPHLQPLPPHLSLLFSNNAFPVLTHEIFCEHCQRTQVNVNDLREGIRFILNQIVERLDVLAHKNTLRLV